jgi:hypothetical protein
VLLVSLKVLLFLIDTSGLNDSRYGLLLDPKSAVEAKKNLSPAGYRVVFQVPDFFPIHSVANTVSFFVEFQQ